MNLTMRSIGIIRTLFIDKDNMPIQASRSMAIYSMIGENISKENSH
jgi:hypothetical protein